MGSFILEAFHFIGYILSYFSNGFLFFRRFLIFLVELIFFFFILFCKGRKITRFRKLVMFSRERA